MSGIIQKVKEAVVGHPEDTHNTHSSSTGLTGPSHTGQYQTKETAGPHRSDVANKVDPRVDSDRDGRGALNTGTGGFGSKQATNYGPHGTIGNKLDPTVTSDHGNAHRATGGGAYNTGAYGSTNAGPHDSNLANKLDPTVDSDRDHCAGHNTHGTSGLTGTHETTAGPHSSNLANKADPRVDSDRDGRSGLGNTHNAYGTSGLTGTHNTHGTSGLTGTHNTTAGPHSSNLANKLDPRVDSDRDHGLTGTSGHLNDNSLGGGSALTAAAYASPQGGLGHTPAGSHQTHAASGVTGHYDNSSYGSTPHTTSTNAGPHSSNLANKLDPRVDSDRDNRAAHHGGVSAIGVPGAQHSATHNTQTTAGPHSSNLANKLDPSVDSDRDHRAQGGLTGTHNTHATGTGYNTHNTGSGLTGSHNTHTTAGPHSSNLANKLDPSVDSDRDHRAQGGLISTTDSRVAPHTTLNTGATHGNTHGGLAGTHNTTTAGPHSSNLANKADPRVDSDRDHRAAGHTAGHTGATGATGLSGAIPSAHHTGPAPHTAGPHKSDLLNKIDPRVDSDLDGSKTYGGNKTFAAPGAHHQ